MGDAPGKRAKVLVVDDESIMRELLRLHLGASGYDVILAEDAVAAGPLVVDEAPDLILVDVEMPYMAGYEFVAALKSDPSTRHIPVVFLTTLEDVAEQAAKLGAAAYLNKPVTVDRLLEIIALCLRK